MAEHLLTMPKALDSILRVQEEERRWGDSVGFFSSGHFKFVLLPCTF